MKKKKMSIRRAVTPLKLREEKTEVTVKRGGAKTEQLAGRVQQIAAAILRNMQSITENDTDCNTVLMKIKELINSLEAFSSLLGPLLNNSKEGRKTNAADIAYVQGLVSDLVKKIGQDIKRFINSVSYLRSKSIILYDTERLKLNRENSFNFSKTEDYEKTLANFTNYLKTIHCPGMKSPYEDITTDTKPTIETFDTTLLEAFESIREFDTPEDVYRWFGVNDRQNYFMYLYGVGKILKTKEALLTKLSQSLADQISKTNLDYNSGIRQIRGVVPSLSFVDPDVSKKEKLIDEIVETTNKSYTTQFNELLQKKIRYDETIKKLRNRRAYLVYQMNMSDQGFGEVVGNKIMSRVNDLYEYYRGVRYKDIRKMIYSFVVICAYNPEIIEKSFILNTSITGPAGSGKTTMARKLAIWFTTVGFLTNDAFLENEDLSYREVGAPQLIAQYVGQTAPMTQGVLYSSLEQCLFIDEAYSVAGCSFDSTGKLQPSQYGEEFIAVLLPFMANHQGIGNIIVAGYKNLMESCFFDRNEGLPRRFPTKIDLPLYTTDELYDMFLNFNIIRRQVSSIKRADVKEEYRRAKQIIYIGIKPAFLMFHYDTSFSAFEIMRKYLLLLEIRKQQFQAGGYKKAVPTHSYTIANHVLTNVICSSLRRNIIRLHFYKEVFGFEHQNLSWFPAQAGEMGLVADMVNRKIEVAMNEKKKNGERQGFISIEQETDVFDTYFENKPVRIAYFKEGKDQPAFVEVIKRGYEYEKEKFQQKIENIVIQPILQPILQGVAKLANATPAVVSGSETPSTGQVVVGGESSGQTTSLAPGAAITSSSTTNESTTASSGQTTSLAPGAATTSSSTSNEATTASSGQTTSLAPGAKKENTPFASSPVVAPKKVPLPSLLEIWKLLFERSEEVILSAITTYIEIADKVIPELLKIPENKFPVNMLKTDVYNEQVLINFYKSASNKGESGLFKSETETFLKFKSNYVQKGNKVTLQNPMLFKYEPSPKITDDALWEDFAFKKKD